MAKLIKLMASQVEEMRLRYAAGGVSQLTLSIDYDVSQSQVGRILRGEQWQREPSTRTKDRSPGERYKVEAKQ